MKYYILFSIFLFSITLAAQEQIDVKEPLTYTETGEVVFQKILHYPGKTKRELSFIAREWFAKKFDGELVQLEEDSKELNTLIGRGIYVHPVRSSIEVINEVFYVLTISTKTERIKVEMEEIFITGPISTFSTDATLPKPAHNVIGDKALYKRNGKVRKLRGIYKKRVLGLWYETLENIDGFFSLTKRADDW